jgi:hypothetical protein
MAFGFGLLFFFGFLFPMLFLGLVFFFIVRGIRNNASKLNEKIDSGEAEVEMLEKVNQRFSDKKISGSDLSSVYFLRQYSDSKISKRGKEELYDFFVNQSEKPEIISEVIWTKTGISKSLFRMVALSKTKNHLVKTEIRGEKIYSYIDEKLVGIISMKDKSIYDSKGKKIGHFESPDFYFSSINLAGIPIRTLKENLVKIFFGNKKIAEVLLTNSFFETRFSGISGEYDLARMDHILSEDKIALILSYSLFVKVKRVLNYVLSKRRHI